MKWANISTRTFYQSGLALENENLPLLFCCCRRSPAMSLSSPFTCGDMLHFSSYAGTTRRKDSKYFAASLRYAATVAAVSSSRDPSARCRPWGDTPGPGYPRRRVRHTDFRRTAAAPEASIPQDILKIGNFAPPKSTLAPGPEACAGFSMFEIALFL